MASLNIPWDKLLNSDVYRNASDNRKGELQNKWLDSLMDRLGKDAIASESERISDRLLRQTTLSQGQIYNAMKKAGYTPSAEEANAMNMTEREVNPSSDIDYANNPLANAYGRYASGGLKIMERAWNGVGYTLQGLDWLKEKIGLSTGESAFKPFAFAQADYLKNQRELLEQEMNVDADVLKHLKDKNWVKALDSLSYGVQSELPSLGVQAVLGLMGDVIGPMSYMGRVGNAIPRVSVSTLYMGLSSAGDKYNELRNDDSLSDDQKMAIATIHGALEAFFEKVSTEERLKELAGGEGAVLKKFLEEPRLKPIIRTAIKQISAAGTAEAQEEATTEVFQELNDKLGRAKSLEEAKEILRNFDWKGTIHKAMNAGIVAFGSGALLGGGEVSNDIASIRNYTANSRADFNRILGLKPETRMPAKYATQEQRNAALKKLFDEGEPITVGEPTEDERLGALQFAMDVMNQRGVDEKTKGADGDKYRKLKEKYDAIMQPRIEAENAAREAERRAEEERLAEAKDSLRQRYEKLKERYGAFGDSSFRNRKRTGADGVDLLEKAVESGDGELFDSTLEKLQPELDKWQEKHGQKAAPAELARTEQAEEAGAEQGEERFQMPPVATAKEVGVQAATKNESAELDAAIENRKEQARRAANAKRAKEVRHETFAQAVEDVKRKNPGFTIKTYANSQEMAKDKAVISRLRAALGNIASTLTDEEIADRVEAANLNDGTGAVVVNEAILNNGDYNYIFNKLNNHEVGVHSGLSLALGGERYNKLMNQIFNERESDVKSMMATFNYKFKYDTDKGRADAAEEYLARVSERGVQRPAWWREFISQVRQILRDLGFNVKVTDSDIEALLRKGQRAAQRMTFPTRTSNAKASISNLWTGSAADYDKPSLHYIGTGEGAQVFGWGLYSTDNKDIAKWYAEKDANNRNNINIIYKGHKIASGDGFELSRHGIKPRSVESSAFYYLFNARGDVELAKHIIPINYEDRKEIQDFIDNGDYKIEKGSRHLYRQTWFLNRVNDGEANLLDWNGKVTEEQLKQINDALRKEGLELEDMHLSKDTEHILYKQYDEIQSIENEGKKLYRNIVEAATMKYFDDQGLLWDPDMESEPQLGSEFLFRAGIDGIRYPADSHGKGDGSQGWNYVSFSDDNMRVDEHIKFSLAPSDYKPERTYHDVTGKWLYKTMRLVDGHLEYPMAGTGVEVPVGVWLKADDNSVVDKKTGKRITPLEFGSKKLKRDGSIARTKGTAAPFPGFHAGSLPYMAHIGLGGTPDQKHFQNADYVWVQIDAPYDRAEEYAEMIGDKDPDKVMRGVIPDNGMYWRKTNPNMKGKWGVLGQMKIVKVLGDDEVDALLDKEMPERVRMGRQGGGRFNAETMKIEGQDLSNWNLEEEEAKLTGEAMKVDGMERTIVDSASQTVASLGQQTAKLSQISLQEGFGLDIGDTSDPNAKWVTRNKKKLVNFTEDDVRNSPIGFLVDLAVKNSAITQAEAEKQIKFWKEFARLMGSQDDLALTQNFVGTLLFTAMKMNSDKQYGTTWDFPSVCTKTQAMIDAMSALMLKKGKGLSKAEIENLYEQVALNGLPVPCPECYVFSRWVGIGGLLDNIKLYQDKYKDMPFNEVVDKFMKMNEDIKKYAKEWGLTFGKAKSRMQEYSEKYYSYEEKIQNSEKPKQKDIDKLNEFKPFAESVKEYSWLQKVYFNGQVEETDDGIRVTARGMNPNAIVADSVLFDLNKSEEFAMNYPEAWQFRKTQGAGYGKAITPPTESVLGEGLMVLNSKDYIDKKLEHGREHPGERLRTPFLDKNQKQSEKIIESVTKKMISQKFLGGQRWQSTSDARPEYMTDYLLAALEMQTVKASSQIYSKVDGSIPFFSAIRAFSNQSLMPKPGGVDDNGNIMDTDVGGMVPEKAFENRRKSDLAGTITIALNDRHARALVKNEQRDFSIPFHASGGDMAMEAEFRRSQEIDSSGIEKIQPTDYTTTQADKILSDDLLKSYMGLDDEGVELVHKRREARIALLTGGKADQSVVNGSRFLTELQRRLRNEWNGVKLGKDIIEGQIFPNEFWNTTVDYDHSSVNTQLYLDYCKELGMLHRFSGRIIGEKTVGGKKIKAVKRATGYDNHGKKTLLTDLAYEVDENGNELLDTINPFFWKFLVDHRMYGNNGKYIKEPSINITGVTMDSLQTFGRIAAPGRFYNQEKSASLAKDIRTGALPISETRENDKPLRMFPPVKSTAKLALAPTAAPPTWETASTYKAKLDGLIRSLNIPPLPTDKQITGIVDIDAPGLVAIARELSAPVSASDNLGPGVLGMFRYGREISIKVLRDLAKRQQLTQTLKVPTKDYPSIVQQQRAYWSQRLHCDPAEIEFESKQNSNNGTVFNVYWTDPSQSRVRKVLGHEVGHLFDWTAEHTTRSTGVLGTLLGAHKYAMDFLKAYNGSLYAKNTITRELTELTRWWSGDWTKASEKYRTSPQELYAEAFSVLFCAPDQFRARCPETWAMIQEFQQNRPEAMQAWEDMMVAMTNPSLEGKLLDQLLDEDRKKAEANAKKVTPDPNDSMYSSQLEKFIAMTRRNYQDKFVDIVNLVKRMGLNYGGSPLPSILEMTHMSSVQEYMREMNRLIDKTDLPEEYIDRMLKWHRIAYDPNLDEKVKSLGITAETAKNRIELEKKDDPDSYAKFQAFHKEFWNLRKKGLIALAKRVGAYSGDLLDKLENNEWYATKLVADFVGEEGSHIGTPSAFIHELKGSIEGGADALFATLNNDATLMAALLRNEALLKTIDLVKQEGWAKKTRAVGPSMYAKPDKGWTQLTVLRDGKLEHWDVVSNVGDAFVFKEMWPVAKQLGVAMGWYRWAWTRVRPSFWATNAIRDATSSYYNLPDDIRSRFDLKTWTEYYIRGANETRKYLFSDAGSQLVEGMMWDNYFMTSHSWGDYDVTEGMLENLRKKYGVSKKQKGGLARKVYDKAKGIASDVSNMIEMSSKVAAELLLRERSNLTDAERRRMVVEQMGSPDFAKGGKYSRGMNALFTFFNANVQGMAQSLEAMADHPMAYGKRVMQTMGTQVMLQTILSIGASLIPEPEDKDGILHWIWDKLRWTQRMYRKLSKWQYDNYFVVPVKELPDGRCVFFRMPYADTLKPVQNAIKDVIAHSVGSAYSSQRPLQSELGEAITSYVPEVTPVGMAIGHIMALMAGYNPRDMKTGMPIVDEKAFKAGGLTALFAILIGIWNEDLPVPIRLPTKMEAENMKQFGENIVLELAGVQGIARIQDSEKYNIKADWKKGNRVRALPVR